VELTQHEILAIALAAFGVGFFKATLSMGIGLALVPLMILFWPTRFIIGIIAIHMFTSDYAVIRLFWKQWNWRLAKIVLPGLFVGIIAGTFILVSLPDYWIRKSIGGGCLIFAAIQTWSEFKGEIPPPRIGRWGGLAIGIVGGTVSAITHTGGTVLTLYLLSQGVDKVTLVATVIVIWIFVNPVKVGSYYAGGLVTPTLFLAAIAAVPLAFAGGWIGRKILDRMPQGVFNASVIFLAATAAARLLWE
jgi:uncharacterized membrane protein YfcA